MSTRWLVLLFVAGALVLGGCEPLDEGQAQDAVSPPSEASQLTEEGVPTATTEPPAAKESPTTKEPPTAEAEVPSPVTAERVPRPVATRSFERVPSTTPSTPVKGEVPDALMQEAMADLVARSEATEGEIEVVEAKSVVWRDGSLGCPQPGMMYTMALVEGYQIKLRYDGQVYAYHASTNQVFLCENSLTSAPLERELTPELNLLNLAAADLAQRLGVAQDEVKPESVERRTWPDASLGCPQPGQVYAQVETPGYVLVFTVDGQSFTYHTDLERVVYCESQ